MQKPIKKYINERTVIIEKDCEKIHAHNKINLVVI